MLYIQKTQTGRRARKITQSEGMDLVRKGVAVLAKQGGHQIYADCSLFHPDRLRMLQAKQGNMELPPPENIDEVPDEEPVQTYKTRDLKPAPRRRRTVPRAQHSNASQ